MDVTTSGERWPQQTTSCIYQNNKKYGDTDMLFTMVGGGTDHHLEP